MASFEIRWKRSASKELKKLPLPVIGKVLSTVEALAADPIPATAKKLHGTEFTYRIRIGDYRLVYNVLDRVLTVEVVRVRHRKEVYRNFP